MLFSGPVFLWVRKILQIRQPAKFSPTFPQDFPTKIKTNSPGSFCRCAGRTVRIIVISDAISTLILKRFIEASENLLRTLLRSVLLDDPLGVHPKMAWGRLLQPE